MAAPITVNEVNAIQNSDGTYSSFSYTFPTVQDFTNKEIQLNKIVCPFSWFNISSRFQNNSFQIVWVDGTTATVNIPDGYYTISTLNLFLEQFFINQTWYTINNAGDPNETFNYYISMAENTTYYAVQLQSLNVPTAAQAAAAGITLPAGATWAFPAVTTNPQIIIPTFTKNNYNTSFSQFVGFNPQTWPVAQTPGSNQSILSNFTPNVNPVSTVNLLINLVYNQFSFNDALMYTFSTSNTTFGADFQEQIGQDTWYLARKGNFPTLTIRLVDQSLSTPVLLRDVSSFSILLSVRDSPAESRQQKFTLTAR